MRKHYFLGFGACYSAKERWAILFSRGREKDYFELQNYIKKEYKAHQVLITRNGRSAIAAGLKYYFNERGGEVIINGLTCYAVIQGIKAAGMKPVYADVNTKDLNFTASSIEKVLSPKTRAIMVQNTLGNMVNIREIEKFAKKHKLVIIEDLAHCVGRVYEDGREAGTVGALAIFTFGKEKVIDMVNGGAVAFRNAVAPVVNSPKLRPPFSEVLRARIYPTLGAFCRMMSYLGLSGIFMRLFLKLRLIKKSADGEIDFNERHLSYFQAKLALEQFKKRKKNNKKLLREFYLVNNRAEVLARLERAGYYFSGFWFDKPVMPERYYKKAHFPEKECPEAMFASEHIINLPNYYTKKDLEPARKIIAEYLVDNNKGGGK